MKITSLTLNDFSLHKDSGISKFHVEFTENVQVVMGSNGSGKTITTRQLSTKPTVKTLFGKEGFKSLVVQKDNTYYRMESDYSKPSSPHLFFEGDSDENLNVGRTTQTQQELIVEYLGITPLLDDLIMNRLSFPSWKPTQRKEFMMSTNPNEIGFVLGLIKQTSSKIKACRNNLSRLLERKILLEQQMLDEDALVSLNKEKNQITSELSDFQQNLMDIEVGVRTIGPVNQVTIDGLPSVRKVIKRCRNQLATLSHIERNDKQRLFAKQKTLSSIAVCEQQIVSATEEIATLSNELNDMETRYRDIAIDGDLQQIDETIARLEMDRERLHVTRPDFELSQEDLDRRYDELNHLRDQLLIFNQLNVRLLPAKRRQHRERKLQTLQYRQSSWSNRLNDLEHQYEELSRRHRLKPSDIPDSPCAKNACPLYSHFMGEYTEYEQKRMKVGQSIEKGRYMLNRLNQVVTGLLNYFEQVKPYTQQINALVDYARSNPILHQILRKMDILSVLTTNPNRITQQLEQAYGQVEQWLRLKSVLSDLETAHALKSRQISSESHDTIKLVTKIETTKKTLEKLRHDVYGEHARQQQLQKLLHEIDLFDEIKSTIMDIKNNHIELSKSLVDGYQKNRLITLKRSIDDFRTHLFLRMSEIEKTLRAQSGLNERYQEEVINQIGAIEKELADLQQIESGLIIVSRENMIGFINKIFDQANRFIDSVWTIPLSIDLLGPDDSLDYTFTVSGDNQSSRELGECSEGQTEIISLAINLALRVILKHFDYPLILDEPARTMDDKHRSNFVALLKKLLDERVISQLFIVSHHAVVHESFAHSETLVLREDNVLLPKVYNQHVTIN